VCFHVLMCVWQVTGENFLRSVQYGTVTGAHIRSLLRLMTGIYAPIFFRNTSWPDSIKNDFSAQLHKFLASLTDTRWKMEGKTVLYIPNEGLSMDAELASKNKELVQRLESQYTFSGTTQKYAIVKINHVTLSSGWLQGQWAAGILIILHNDSVFELYIYPVLL
jgi:hypothetical protein